jgi:Metal binding domain of Ada
MDVGILRTSLMYNNGMSIQEVLRKFKDFWFSADMVLVLIIVVTAGASFMLGRLSEGESTQVPSVQRTQSAQTITSTKEESNSEPKMSPPTTVPTPQTEGKYVASKSGTKYHLPWCGSAKSIKEENKVWFETKEEAEKAGYAPASNCKGI